MCCAEERSKDHARGEDRRRPVGREAYGSDAIRRSRTLQSTPSASVSAPAKQLRADPAAAAIRGHGRCSGGWRAVIAGIGVSGPQIVEGVRQPWGSVLGIRDSSRSCARCSSGRIRWRRRSQGSRCRTRAPARRRRKADTPIMHMIAELRSGSAPDRPNEGRRRSRRVAAARVVPRLMPRLHVGIEEGLRRAGGGRAPRASRSGARRSSSPTT